MSNTFIWMLWIKDSIRLDYRTLFMLHLELSIVSTLIFVVVRKGKLYIFIVEQLPSRSLVCIQDQIYLRDEQNQSQEPFILIDRISLSKLETTEDKIKQIRNKRSFISDDWNKQFLEITDQEAFEVEFAKGTLSEYRSVSYTPVFTDSQSIYIIATYCKSSSSENRT